MHATKRRLFLAAAATLLVAPTQARSQDLPGNKINTSATNHRPLRQMQLQRWNGKGWERMGSIIEGAKL